jgi:hypothetical protein
MTVLITLSGVGSSAGPTFNLYASPDGITFTTIVEGIDKTDLEAGYTATVPDGTTEIKVTSVGVCTNSYVATIGLIPTTTTTTTTEVPLQLVVASAGDSVCGQTMIEGQLSVSLSNSELCPSGLNYPVNLYTTTGALSPGDIVYYYSDGEYVPYDLGNFFCEGNDYQSGYVYYADSESKIVQWAEQGQIAPEYVDCTFCS